MKGLHTSLIIVIAAIVILIVALIVLTIFGVGIGGVTPYLSQQNICSTNYVTSCSVTGSPPANWNDGVKVNIGGKSCVKSCKELVACGTDGTDCPANVVCTPNTAVSC